MEQRSSKLGSQALVHDVVVNVTISSQHGMASSYQPGFGHQFPDSNGLKTARMAVSPWNMEQQLYFTITFTSCADSSISSTSTQPCGKSEAEHKGALSETSAPMPSSTMSALGDHHRDSLTATTYAPMKSGPSIALASDLGGLSISHINTPSTTLETVNRMKDAMIDSLETSVVAICYNKSIAIANKAAMALMQPETDSASDALSNLLARLKVYTEDFGRELQPEEHPIIRICKSQKPFDKQKVGILDSKARRKRIEVRGEIIHDKGTEEFSVGVIFMKDVTEYAEIITNQLQAGQQQFQLICDTIPQMVWLMQIDGVEAMN